MALIVVAGNVGQDATYTEKDGRGMAWFSVAESEKVKGEKVTTWYNVTVFGQTANFCRDYIKKGRTVMVNGRPSARAYKNKLEELVAGIDILANDVRLIGSMREGNEPSGQNQQTPSAFVPVDEADMPF